MCCLHPKEFKAVSVRFFANPELEDRSVSETEAMCQKTIQLLEWLRDRHPLLVLMPDRHSPDPHCVMVIALGKRVANLSKEDAREARGMMSALDTNRLMCMMSDVVVAAHGYFYIHKPECDKPHLSEPIGVDWSQWEAKEVLLLPDDEMNCAEALSAVINEALLPQLDADGIETELAEYMTLWMAAVRFDQSREVQQEMDNYIQLLSANSKESIRRMAAEIDHLRTQKGTREHIAAMANEWWNGLLALKAVTESFALIKARYVHESEQMKALLQQVDEWMRPMPGELYNDVGDACSFFCHLGYLSPPRKALRGVLSLYAIRTLVCREMGLDAGPQWMEPKPAVSVRDIPLTLGDVIDFTASQCDSRNEKQTMQRFAMQMHSRFLGQPQEVISDMSRMPSLTQQMDDGAARIADAIRSTPIHIDRINDVHGNESVAIGGF